MIDDFKLKTGLQIHKEKASFPGKGLVSSAVQQPQ
jgi:hypothetical protein